MNDRSFRVFYVPLLAIIILTSHVNCVMSSIDQSDHHNWREDGDYLEFKSTKPINHAQNEVLVDQMTNWYRPYNSSESPSSLFQTELPFDENLNLVLPAFKAKRLYFQVFKRQQWNVTLRITPCFISDPGLSNIHLQLFYINWKMIKKFRKRKINLKRRSMLNNENNYLMKMIQRKMLKSQRKLLIFDQTINKALHLPLDLDESKQLVFNAGVYIIQLTSIDGSDSLVQMYLSNGIEMTPPLPPVATIIAQQRFMHLEYMMNNEPSGTEDTPTTVEIWFNPIPDAELETHIGRYEYCLRIRLNKPFRDECFIQLDDINDEPSKSFDLFEGNPSENQRRTYYFKCWPQLNQTRLFIHGLSPTSMNEIYFVDIFIRQRKWPISPGQNSTPLTSCYWATNFTLKDPDSEKKLWQIHLQSMQTLHDSLFTGVFLDSKNSYRKRFRYKYSIEGTSFSENLNHIYIYIQPCSGLGPIQFMVKQINVDQGYFEDQIRLNKRTTKRHKNHRFRHHRQSSDMDNLIDDDLSIILTEGMDIIDENGKRKESTSSQQDVNDQDDVLFFEEITETRTIELTIPTMVGPNRTMYLEFEMNTIQMLQTRSLVLLVSESLKRFPFPRLPQDKSLRPMETLRKCDSITLVWNASPDEKVTYCILQRDAKYGLPFESHAEQELCRKIAPPERATRTIDHRHKQNYDIEYSQVTPTRKVLCRRYRAKKRINQNLIMQQIRKLQPGRQYIFMVTIKARQHTLHYEQIWADTKTIDQCIPGQPKQNTTYT